MSNTSGYLGSRIAERIRDLRQRQGLSLEGLAEKCGVSRSMISLIERGETSPTAVVLEKLADGLDVEFASLFDGPAVNGDSQHGVVRRREDQSEWSDPASGYLRRNLSPPGIDQRLQLVEVVFPPGERVIFDAGPRNDMVHQQIWMLEGEMEIGTGSAMHQLHAGDCLARHQHANTVYHNPGTVAARYVVALSYGNVARKDAGR
jgi:transcriptional regulator with XRE-family HTH domain